MLDSLIFAHACAFLLMTGLIGLYLAYTKKISEIAVVDAFALILSSMTYWGIFFREEEYIRWIGYTFACGCFAYASARVLSRSEIRSLVSALFMSVTLLTGALIYFVDTNAFRITLFTFGSVTYILSLAIMAVPMKQPRWFWPQYVYFIYLVVFWSAYPVVFALGPEFEHVISARNERISYFALEFPAKYGLAIFSTLLYVWMTKKTNRVPNLVTK